MPATGESDEQRRVRFARRVRDLRTEAGLRQEEVAVLTRIPLVDYQRIERGDKPFPGERLDEFAALFGRSEADFYSSAPPGPPDPKKLRAAFFMFRHPALHVDADLERDVLADLAKANQRALTRPRTDPTLAARVDAIRARQARSAKAR